MYEGICRLCNTFGPLSYEHVPPKVTLNKKTRYKKINFNDYLKERNPIGITFKGKVEQGGIGFYSLCKSCNSFLGLTYVKDYQKYSNSFVEFARKKESNYFELTMHDFYALNVIKQIISMFLSINDEKFSQENRDLAEFVLDPKANDLPSRFRVYNYLNTEGQFRYLPQMVIGDLKSKGILKGSELAFPPLGHVMTIDFKGELPYHQEITSFKEISFATTISFDFKLYRFPTYLPILLDYRDKQTIFTNIEESS